MAKKRSTLASDSASIFYHAVFMLLSVIIAWQVLSKEKKTHPELVSVIEGTKQV